MNNFYNSISANAINAKLYYGEEKIDNIFGQPSLDGYHQVIIHNAVKNKHPQNLEQEGFCKIEENSGFNDFTNEDKLKNIYFPIVKEIIKK